MEVLGIASVATITVICMLIGEAVKLTKLDNKFIPVICASFGAILGIVGMYTMADFPANDILTALAVGIVSGFAATGVHQMAKQLKEK